MDSLLETQRLGIIEGGGWLWLLAVLAAPLWEELLFRGLLLGGMRPTIPARWAVFASALLFALIHPALSVLPVLGLGLVCGVLRWCSDWLVPGLIAHATYNALVLAMAS